MDSSEEKWKITHEAKKANFLFIKADMFQIHQILKKHVQHSNFVHFFSFYEDIIHFMWFFDWSKQKKAVKQGI